MSKSHKKKFQKYFNLLAEYELIKHARHKGSNIFYRNRKMSLKDMLLCFLSKKGLITVFERRNYFKAKEEKLCYYLYKDIYGNENT